MHWHEYLLENPNEKFILVLVVWKEIVDVCGVHDEHVSHTGHHKLQVPVTRPAKANY